MAKKNMLAALQTLDGNGTPRQRRVVKLPRGRAGIARTLRMIVAEAARSMYLPQVRRLALRITRDLPEKDSRAEAQAVQEWVRKHIRYVRDPKGREVVQSATLTLKLGQGDCDDHTVLIAALLGSIGHAMRGTAIGMKPGRFQHVMPEDFIGGQWVTVEATEDWPLGHVPHGIKEHMSRNIPTGGDTVGDLGLFSGVTHWVSHTAAKVEDVVRPLAPVAAGAVANFFAPGSGVAVASAFGTLQQAQQAQLSADKQARAQDAYNKSLDDAAQQAAQLVGRPDLEQTFRARLVAAGPNAQAELNKIIAEYSTPQAPAATATPAAAAPGNPLERYKLPLMVGGGVLGTLLAVRLMMPQPRARR